MEERSSKLIKLKTHFEYFADDVFVVNNLFGLLDPFVDDFFVGVLLDFKSLERLKLFEGDEVEEDEAEAEDVGLERIGRYYLFALDFNQLWC